MQIPAGSLAKPYDGGKAEAVLKEASAAIADDELKAALQTPEAAALTAALAGNSPYLARAIGLNPDWYARILGDEPDRLFEAELAALAQEGPQLESAEALMRRLRRAKGRLALLVAAADVAAAWPLAKVTGALSRFAGLALALATARLLHDRMRKGELDWPRGAPEPPEGALNEGSGLIVLAMGKLGAGELNYSSDIDLIVLYDAEVIDYRGKRSLSDCMVRLAQDLVRMMEARTADGYVFRTDLRLRPDPGATPLAVSVAAAETYYQSAALNWERAAMIKAWPVAGDIAAGKAYLRRIAPFIWRRSLDYAAIEDIHAIKNQIHRHHRHKGTPLAGYDVKLGPGGIREIEFYAQLNQLIHGGRDPSLRERPTLTALDRLAETGRLDPAVRNDLKEAYVFLRMVEHRLQMSEDAQTHSLPDSQTGLERVALFCGFDDLEGFAGALSRHREHVQRHYDDLLPDAPDAPALPSGDALPAHLAELGFGAPESASGIVERWRRGRYRSLKTARARALLESFLPALLDALSATAEPDRGLARFDAFLEKLPAGVQLFSLFQSNPSLFRLIARIMGVAPALSDLLAKRAQLIDALLDPDFFAPLPEQDALRADFDDEVARARDYQDVLDIARRWTDDRRFQIGVQTLEALTPVREASESMTDLADVSVAGLLVHVQGDYAKRHGRFPGGALGIVAMGKYGGRELSFGSDLDVVLLYDVTGEATQSDGPKPVGRSRYFSGLGQAVVTAVTAMTAEGRLWDLDTRLRPSGRAGPLVVTCTTFEDYYRGAAWTWEHMALTRARVIAAPPALAERIEGAVRATLTAERDAAALLPAVADMRRRLDGEFGTDNIWTVKHARGGLVDVEFVIQYLLLREGARHPRIFRPRIEDCADALCAAGILRESEGAKLKAAYELQSALQSILRLAFAGEAPEAAFAPELKATLARAAGLDRFDQVRDALSSAQADVRAIYDKIIAGPAAALAPDSTPGGETP